MLRYEYPDDLTPAGISDADWLRQLTEEGVRRRWPNGEPKKVRDQIEGLVERDGKGTRGIDHASQRVLVHRSVPSQRADGDAIRTDASETVDLVEGPVQGVRMRDEVGRGLRPGRRPWRPA